MVFQHVQSRLKRKTMGFFKEALEERSGELFPIRPSIYLIQGYKWAPEDKKQDRKCCRESDVSTMTTSHKSMSD
jgi:hypothetical protein